LDLICLGHLALASGMFLECVDWVLGMPLFRAWPAFGPCFGPSARVSRRIQGRGPVCTSERDSRDVPTTRNRQISVETQNAMSCSRLLFAAHTR